MKPDLLSSAILASALLLACNKEEVPEPQQPEAEKYSVTFRVGNLDQYIEDLPDKLTEQLGQDDNYINFIDFFIYDAEGELTRSSQQEDWTVEFPPEFGYLYGEAHFWLEPGNYKLVVFGTEKDQKYLDSTAYSTAYLALNYENAIGDIFYKEVPFTVTGAELIDTVRLDRIVGQVEFHLTERLDPIVKHMSFYMETVDKFPFDPDNNHRISWTYADLIEGEFKPYLTENFLWRATILPDRSGKFDTKTILTVDGPKSFIVEQRSLKGVFAYPNKKTVIRGSLWNNKPLQNFYIEADSTYGETIYIDADDLEWTYL